MGVDVGTYETKATAVDDAGRVVATARHPHRLSVPAPGWAEHDAELVWWDGFVVVVRALLKAEAMRSARVVGLCCSGIGPAVLPVSADGRPLRPAILYGIDTRAAAQVSRIETMLGRGEVLSRSGNQLSAQSAGPKIAWLAEHEPEVHAAAAVFHTCQSFLVSRLTGESVVDHLTASYFHPLYSLREQQWDVSGCEGFVRRDQLPRLAWSDEVAGQLRADAAALTGLPAGIPVLVGSADAPCEALAAGVEQPGSTMVMYGSSGFMIAPTDGPKPGGELYCAPGLTAGSWLVAAGTSTAGTATRWLTELLDLRGADTAAVFAELVALASSAPKGSRGLLVLPHFSGERTPVNDPDAQGVIHGLTLGHGRAELARAVLEGVAHSMVWALESVLTHIDARHTAQQVVAIGGGTANPVWLQAVSDISGRSQQVSTSPGASYGGALLGARTVGLLSHDPERRWHSVTQQVVADADAHPGYTRDHDRFVQVYAALARMRAA